MKKDFIQKLSIAMASALVITSVAPAATADAATKMAMNKTSKILYLNADNSTNTGSDFDFNITNKGKDYKKKYTFKWSVTKDGIVDLNTKNGKVEAVGVGKTTVQCKVYKKTTNKLYKTIKATVEVKANADTVVIKNLPEEGKMLVGTTWDFNRTMKNADGGKATDKTEWLLFADEALTEKCTTATVDSQGVVTAKEAGTFYVVARAYQSKATKDITTAKSEAVKVTVPITMTDIKLTKATEVELTFDSSVKDVIKTNSDVEIYTVGTNRIKYPIKSVKVSEDGKKATVESYQRFTNDTTYSVKTAGNTKEFTAEIGTIASIVLTNATIPVTAGKVSLKDIGAYKVYDAKGVDITCDFEVSASSLAVLSSQNNGSFVDNEGKFWMNKNGDAVTVQLKYFKYNTTTGADESIFSNTATYTCSDSVAVSTSMWAIAANNKSSYPYGTSTQTVNAEDNTKRIYVMFKDNFNNNVSSTDYENKFSFESYDTSILVVDRKGNLYPKKAGTVTVKVTCGSYVEYLTITVREKATVGSIEVDKVAYTLSNSEDLNAPDSVTVTFSVKDIYGDKYVAAKDDETELITRYKCDGVNADKKTLKFDADGKATVTFTVDTNAIKDNTEGNGYYVINYGGKYASTQISLRTPGGATQYRVTMKDTNNDTRDTLDCYPNSWETQKGSAVVSLWNVDTKDILISEATGDNITYKVLKADGTVLVGKNDKVKYEGNFKTQNTFTINAKYDNIQPGTYTINFYNQTTSGIEYVIYSKTFTVVSSKKSAYVTANKVSFKVDSYDVMTELKGAFDFVVDGNKQKQDDVSNVVFKYNIIDNDYISGEKDAGNGNVTGGSIVWTNKDGVTKNEVRINVTNVQFTVGGVDYSVDLNQPIVFKKNY